MAISSFTSRFMPPLKSVVVSGIEATRRQINKRRRANIEVVADEEEIEKRHENQHRASNNVLVQVGKVRVGNAIILRQLGSLIVTPETMRHQRAADRSRNVVEGEEGGPHRTLIADGAGTRCHDQHGDERELAGERVNVHDDDGDPVMDVGIVEQTRDEVDLQQRCQTRGDRGPNDDDREVLADEEAIVHEGGDEREDRCADVQCVVLPSLHAHIDGQVRVDVGGGGGHGRTH